MTLLMAARQFALEFFFVCMHEYIYVSYLYKDEPVLMKFSEYAMGKVYPKKYFKGWRGEGGLIISSILLYFIINQITWLINFPCNLCLSCPNTSKKPGPT